MYAVIALLLCSSVRGLDAPAARACHALVYHEGLEQVVLLGGASACGTTVLDDRRLWGWDGARWSVLAEGGPSAREDPLLAYDAKRAVLVLYGGRNGPRVHEDTWEWDGTAWREISAGTRPGPLEHAAMAFDAARERVVLVGGGFRAPPDLNGATWEWDGKEWQRSQATGPRARVGPAMTRDGKDGRAVLFGGFDPDAGSFRDLWRWEEGRWRELAHDAPVTTEGHCVAGTSDALVVLGLAPDDATPDGPFLSMRFADGTWTQVPGAAPPWRVGGALAHDRRRDALVLFGGHDPTAHRTLSDLWELRADGWRLVEVAEQR